jgi:hypothetical protein
MKSRTAKGKHTPRFIVEFTTERDTYRSGNTGLSGFFATRKAAQAAIARKAAQAAIAMHGSYGIDYKVRQK